MTIREQRDLLEEGYFREAMAIRNECNRRLEELSRLHSDQLHDLQQECAGSQHGHEDDGSLFYGYCKHCGVCLG